MTASETSAHSCHPVRNKQATTTLDDTTTTPGVRVAPRRGNNARMHPRNRYAFIQPDFEALAREHPSLGQFLVPSSALRRGKRRRGQVAAQKACALMYTICDNTLHRMRRRRALLAGI